MTLTLCEVFGEEKHFGVFSLIYPALFALFLIGLASRGIL